MSKEIHFLEDGYYVDKLEKDIEKLKEKCNQLKIMVKTYKEVIEDIRIYVEDSPNQMSEDATYYLLQILDKVKGEKYEKS